MNTRHARSGAVIALLAERWPQCFAVFEQRRKPIKVGIHRDITAALASACAGHLDTPAPTYVSPSTFENLTCRQIGEEQKRITRAEATGGRLDGKPGTADDIALLKGAMEALEQVSIEKNCNIEFQHG
jgi:hypothetical protein